MSGERRMDEPGAGIIPGGVALVAGDLGMNGTAGLQRTEHKRGIS